MAEKFEIGGPLSTKVNEVRESEVDFIGNRINLVKRFHGCFCYHFASYTRKTGRVRDKGDELAKFMVMYSDCEPLHQSMKQSLLQFAAVLGAVQDYRQKRIDRLEERVVCSLTKYEAICKAAKAEGKLFKATTNANKNMKAIMELAIEFEDRKLNDLKRIMLNFVKTEMVFHAKALELYTSAWATAMNFDVNADMKKFCQYMQTQSYAWKALDAEVYEEHGNIDDGEGSQLPQTSTGTDENCTTSKRQHEKRSDDSIDDDEFMAVIENYCQQYNGRYNVKQKSPRCCDSKSNSWTSSGQC